MESFNPDDQNVSDHNPAEASLALLETILAHVPIGFAFLDQNLRYVRISQSLAQINGMPAEAHIGRTVEEVLGQSHWPARKALLDRALAGEAMVDFTLPGTPSLDAEGPRRFLASYFPVRAGKKVVGVAAVVRDMTEQVHSQEALRRSEARYRAVFEALTEGVTVQDATGLFQESNPSAEHILGLTRDQMAGRTSADPRWRTVHEDGSSMGGEEHPPMLALRTGQAVRDMLMGIHRSDGTFAWLSANAELIPDLTTGEPTGVVTSFFDITILREAQKDLKTRAERAALLNRIGQAVRATTDPELIQETAAALVGEALGVDRCYFSVYDPHKDAVRIARDWHRPDLSSVTGEYSLAEYQGYVDALYSSGTAIVADALNPDVPPNVQRVLGGFGIRAFLAVPLFDGGKFTAALAASMNGKARSWTPDEVSLMEAVLTQTRTAVEATRTLQRERRFLRDVLASVTEGKLLLCDTAADLPALLTPFGDPISISTAIGLRELRQATYGACQSTGLSTERSHDLVTAASEAGMNAAVHTGSGTGQVSVSADGTVQVRVEDQGSGISMENLPRATLSRGFSTKATLGHGLKMMLETADRLYLLTGPTGTTVVLEQERDSPILAWL